MDHILYQILKIISIYHQKYETLIDNPSTQIYVTRTEHRITFKVKIGYNLETMKLFVSTEKNS